MEIRAVVLAGGASSRMGVDKAALSIRGATMEERFLAATLPAGLRVPIVVGGDPAWAGGLEWHPDAEPGAGPLPALLHAFEIVRADALVVLACDLVDPRPGALRALVDTFTRLPGSRAVVPGSRFFEPLHALYHRNIVEGLRSARDRGIEGLQAALSSLGVAATPLDALAGGSERLRDEIDRSLGDVDTPDELAAAEAPNTGAARPTGIGNSRPAARH